MRRPLPRYDYCFVCASMSTTQIDRAGEGLWGAYPWHAVASQIERVQSDCSIEERVTPAGKVFLGTSVASACAQTGLDALFAVARAVNARAGWQAVEALELEIVFDDRVDVTATLATLVPILPQDAVERLTIAIRSTRFSCYWSLLNRTGRELLHVLSRHHPALYARLGLQPQTSIAYPAHASATSG